jgi:hypothetical protein
MPAATAVATAINLALTDVGHPQKKVSSGHRFVWIVLFVALEEVDAPGTAVLKYG